MSKENVDLIAELLREFDATKRAPAALPPDFLWDMSHVDGWPEKARYLGPEDIVDAGGDSVVCIIRQRGRLSGSRYWVDLRFGLVYTIIDGEVKGAEIYRTAEDALGAVGWSRSTYSDSPEASRASARLR